MEREREKSKMEIQKDGKVTKRASRKDRKSKVGLKGERVEGKEGR